MTAFIATHWLVVLIASFVALLVAAAGAKMTVIGPWYNSLRFPRWKPPNWAFGPVWTTIFALSTASAVLAWVGAGSATQRSWLVALFAANGLFNILWNVLFFKIRRPDLALIETGALWLSILALIVFIYPISPVASLMLAPYIIWVSIAGVLNLAIVRLNPPFGNLTQPRNI